MSKRKSWAAIAIERKTALSDLIDSLCESQSFEIEAGCSGEGPIVRACRAIRKPLPTELREWLREGDNEMGEEAFGDLT